MKFICILKLSRVILFSLISCIVRAVPFDVSDQSSICAAAKVVANGEWNYYEGIRYGGTVGMFVPPYYWWNAGEAFGGLLTYYTFCEPNNSTLKELIYDGMYHQAGAYYNYIPSNQTMIEGNDDQGVWGLAVMMAAEYNFTDPPHSWLSLTQAIYNTMVVRWDPHTCDGGLRWQIFSWNSGYNYKNTISNACLFNLAARLSRFTGNDTYMDTVDMVWDWLVDVGFMVDVGDEFTIYDGANIYENCTDLTRTKWSYSYGIMLSGAAFAYNHTENITWLERTIKILDVCNYFLNNSIFTETSCSKSLRCNTDQRSFRSLFARSLTWTAILAPTTAGIILEWMEKSAIAAAQSCSGGSDGVTCGFNWNYDGWDGFYGLGEQMSALETIMGMKDNITIYSADTGGTSESDYSAGMNTKTTENPNLIEINTGDKVGAGILTAVILALLLGGAIWMMF